VAGRRSGTFKAPILSADGKTCLGVLTEDGTRYMADRVVLATGAWSPSLVDLQGQCVSKVSCPSRQASLAGLAGLAGRSDGD
jgi:glycine/D-amino acid oxidase-like deaminating enzyme